jgi:hypothetical protein
MEERKRNPNGTFQKGQPSPEGARRKRGVINKITRDIREGAIEGFARHGSDGRGRDGFSGFCYYLAKKHPKAAAKIVEKLLPLTVNGNLPGVAAVSVNIVGVPPGNFLSHDDISRLTAPGLIEHAPIAHEPSIETPRDPQEP